MIYLCILGIIILSFMQVYRFNFITNTFKSKELTIKSLLKTSIGWPVGILFGAMTVVFLYLWQMPGYYIQVIDMIIAIIIISIIDGKSHKIPNSMTITLLTSQIIAAFCVANTYLNIWNVLISAAILALLVFVSKVSKEQIGMGDVKLIVVLNLIYGLSFTVYSMILSLIIMLLCVVPFMIIKKINLKSQIPFAPFFAVGVTVYMLLNLL